VGYCDSMSHVWYCFPTEYCSLPPWTERVGLYLWLNLALVSYENAFSFFVWLHHCELIAWLKDSVESTDQGLVFFWEPVHLRSWYDLLPSSTTTSSALIIIDWLILIVLHSHIWSGFP
jgi:hypothetical protein